MHSIVFEINSFKKEQKCFEFVNYTKKKKLKLKRFEKEAFSYKEINHVRNEHATLTFCPILVKVLCLPWFSKHTRKYHLR